MGNVMKKLLSLVLCFCLLFAVPVLAAEKTVKATPITYGKSEGVKKAKKVGIGTTCIKGIDGGGQASQYAVRFVAPKNGTYTVKVSDYKCDAPTKTDGWVGFLALNEEEGTTSSSQSTWITNMTKQEITDYFTTTGGSVPDFAKKPFATLKTKAKKGEVIYISFDTPCVRDLNECYVTADAKYSCKIKISRVK